MCNLNCQINSQVGGDHAYCDCDCHKDTLPAIPPSRERRKLTMRAADVCPVCEGKGYYYLLSGHPLDCQYCKRANAANANR